LQDARDVFEEFLLEVEPFERSRQNDPEQIDRAYYNMLHTIVGRESARRPVYTNILADRKFLAPLTLAPSGILFKIAGSGSFVERKRFEFNRQLWGNGLIYRDKRVGVILSYYKTAFSSREKYCRFFNRGEEADYYAKMTAEASTVMAEIMNPK
jgi:hypothetical protein